MPLIEKIFKAGETKELIIIADEVKYEALHALVRNRIDGKFLCMTVKIDGMASRKRQNLEDVAALTGATMISYTKGMKLSDIELSDLGTCSKFVATQHKTTIINGAGDTKPTIAQLKVIIKKKENDIDVSDAKERMARLNGGVAIIKVGGKTESEQQELMDRVDDAIRATRSAEEEGIIVGGGCAYLVASENSSRQSFVDSSMKTGESIVHQAIESPFNNILTNANISNKQSWWGFQPSLSDQVRRGILHGYDALNRVPVGRFLTDPTMYKLGIVDPVKVLRTALENAVSIAGVLLTCDTIVVTVGDGEGE